jgi:hypothetical protein
MSTIQPPHGVRPADEQAKVLSSSKTHGSAGQQTMPPHQLRHSNGSITQSNHADDRQMPHAAPQSRYPDPSEEDIDEDPQAHFLSPVQMYEMWDDSDDEDGDDVVDWDAGIIDFGLFHDDHKRAKDANIPLPCKWNHVLTDQAQVYQRVVSRATHNDSEPEFLSRTPSGESLPGLTPDCSPQLQDNLDYESDNDNDDDTSHPQFQLIVTPPPEDSTSALLDDDDEDDLPLSFFVERGRAQRRAVEAARAKTLFSRPGLRGDRTLSGKRHAWRRPYWDLFTIKEGVE